MTDQNEKSTTIRVYEFLQTKVGEKLTNRQIAKGAGFIPPDRHMSSVSAATHNMMNRGMLREVREKVLCEDSKAMVKCYVVKPAVKDRGNLGSKKKPAFGNRTRGVTLPAKAAEPSSMEFSMYGFNISVSPRGVDITTQGDCYCLVGKNHKLGEFQVNITKE